VGATLLFLFVTGGTVAILVLSPSSEKVSYASGGSRSRKSVDKPDLFLERNRYGTKLTRHVPSPQEMPAFPPSEGAQEVLYASENLKLRAWISKDPGDGRRHPAIVYLHGNYCFVPGNWDGIKAYRDAGYVTMTPMVRGENGNPGDFEFFFGEVDDVIAAGRYLAKQPFVDPSRVYVAGHSCGGTLTMLASMLPNPFAAAAAISGSPEQSMVVSQWPDPTPPIFDTADPQEYRLRSAAKYPASIRCPLYLFAGDQEQWTIGMSRQLAKDAKEAGKPCEFIMIPGDHLTAKAPSILKSIEIFKGHSNAKK